MIVRDGNLEHAQTVCTRLFSTPHIRTHKLKELEPGSRLISTYSGTYSIDIYKFTYTAPMYTSLGHRRADSLSQLVTFFCCNPLAKVVCENQHLSEIL